MKGNICAGCLEKVRGTLEGMVAVIEWNSPCEVCGDTAVFYARKDEIKRAKDLKTT